MFIDKNNIKSVFLFQGKVDMRKSINGLTQMIQLVMKENPFSDNIFAFCGKNKRTIKIIRWDKNGFCLWYKKLEKDRFRWPRENDNSVQITVSELEWLLQGLDIRNAHKPVKFDEI